MCVAPTDHLQQLVCHSVTVIHTFCKQSACMQTSTLQKWFPSGPPILQSSCWTNFGALMHIQVAISLSQGQDSLPGQSHEFPPSINTWKMLSGATPENVHQGDLAKDLPCQKHKNHVKSNFCAANSLQKHQQRLLTTHPFNSTSFVLAVGHGNLADMNDTN